MISSDNGNPMISGKPYTSFIRRESKVDLEKNKTNKPRSNMPIQSLGKFTGKISLMLGIFPPSEPVPDSSTSAFLVALSSSSNYSQSSSLQGLFLQCHHRPTPLLTYKNSSIWYMFFCFVFCFLGLHPRHMEMPRLGV